MPFPRKNIRLPAENYIGPRIYFVTICCRDRRPLLAGAAIVSAILPHLRELATRHQFAVHAYCFMPDHLHLLLEGLHTDSNLLAFVHDFKQRTAFDHQKRFAEHRPSFTQNLWQSKFYDHILRHADALEDVAWYIWMNPVRAGLCDAPSSFRFSGSFTSAANLLTPPNPSWLPPWKRAKT